MGIIGPRSAKPGHHLMRHLLSGLVCVAAAFSAVSGEESGFEGQMEWGKENLNAGRYKEAVGLFRGAFKAAKDDPKKQLASGLDLIGALRIIGQYREGLALCDTVLKANPKDQATRCLKGELQTEIGQYQEAMKTFDDLIKENPKHHRAWAMRLAVAVILGKKELIKKTSDHFFDLYDKNKDYYNSDKVKDPLELAYIGLGFQQENAKDAFETGFLLAESVIRKAGARQAYEAFIWSARLAYDKYSFGKAMQRYSEVNQKYRPKLPDALAGMAEVWVTARHKIKSAEPLLQQALKINPNHIRARLAQAVIKITEDNFIEAKAHIDKALAVNPNHLDALAMLAFYHHDFNELEKEKEVEKRVLAINPKHADYYCSIGVLLENKRSYEDATSYYEKAVALDPGYWRGYFGLGMNTSRKGAHGEEEGKRLLLKAFSMNRFSVWARNMILVLDKIIGDKAQGVPPKFATSKTKHFTLKFYKKEAEIMRPYMEEWAEHAYKWQTERFDFEPEGPLTIELMSTNDQSARTVGLPGLPALGVCFGKLCTVVTPKENKARPRKFNWRKVMEHEFGHVMTLQMSKFRVPRWYTEAFSTYLEDDSRIQYDGMMVNYIAKKRLKTIENMNQYFRENPLGAYVHGRYVIEYIDKTFGFDAHRKALRMFATGKKVDTVFPEVTGKSMAELNKGQFTLVDRFFKKVMITPQYDQADFARLEGAARKGNASAQDIANLAKAHFTIRRLELAEAGALKALEMDPKCVDALNILGALTYKKKDYTGAKQLYERSVKADPHRSFRAWQRLGIIYKKEGRTTRAVEALEHARGLYPRYMGDDNPHYILPDLYEDFEPPKRQKALSVWRDAIRVNTEDDEAAKKGLKLAIELKDWKAARVFAERFFEIDPFDRKIHRKAGRVYEELKDLKRAAREYHVATVLDEKDVDSFYDLARMEHAQGNREAAAKAVRAALEIDAMHAGAKKLRRELELK